VHDLPLEDEAVVSSEDDRSAEYDAEVAVMAQNAALEEPSGCAGGPLLARPRP
jgi:hypothetical protein